MMKEENNIRQLLMKNLMREAKDTWGIRGLQNCILNITQYFDKFCEQRGIDYCLMGGSALGAVRHHGFIPWDDDLDVFMRPAEYRKFKQAFQTEGNLNDFYLQEWGSHKDRITFAKLRLNKSNYVEDDLRSLDIHKGIYIDIFILHNCPDNKLAHIWQYFWSRYLVIKSLANRNYKRRGKLVNLILKPLNWIPKRAFLGFALNQIYSGDKCETKNYCHYLGRAGYKKGLYKSDFFRETKRVPFETIELRVPYRVEEYLKERWGDYMQLPSREEIAYYQHSSDWSDYIAFNGFNSEGTYKDEKYLIT